MLFTITLWVSNNFNYNWKFVIYIFLHYLPVRIILLCICKSGNVCMCVCACVRICMCVCVWCLCLCVIRKMNRFFEEVTEFLESFSFYEKGWEGEEGGSGYFESNGKCLSSGNTRSGRGMWKVRDLLVLMRLNIGNRKFASNKGPLDSSRLLD